MQKIKVQYPEYRLQIVGEGNLRGDLETFVRKHDLDDRVDFLGPQPQAEVAKLMRQAKLFILPSTEEGQGVVLVEAMASGTPCIGSDTGGIPTVITPETGRVFEPGNSDVLFKAISFMLTDEAFWHSASLNGRQRVVTYYDWDVLAESIITIYKDVLQVK